MPTIGDKNRYTVIRLEKPVRNKLWLMRIGRETFNDTVKRLISDSEELEKIQR